MAEERIKGYYNYKTKAGDTFDSLALAMYNNERLAHRIISYNPDYSGTVVFESGVLLRLPIYDNEISATPETLPPWRRL